MIGNECVVGTSVTYILVHIPYSRGVGTIATMSTVERYVIVLEVKFNVLHALKCTKHALEHRSKPAEWVNQFCNETAARAF